MAESKAPRHSLAYQELKRNVALAALSESPTAVARRFCVGVGFVRYNLQKLIDPMFHNAGLGGARNTLFDQDEALVVDIVLFQEVLRNPVQSTPEYAATLRTRWGIDVDPRWIARRFDDWGYSFKKVRWKLVLKYSADNILRYANFVSGRWTIPLRHQKYLDEVHFKSTGLALVACMSLSVLSV